MSKEINGKEIKDKSKEEVISDLLNYQHQKGNIPRSKIKDKSKIKT